MLLRRSLPTTLMIASAILIILGLGTPHLSRVSAAPLAASASPNYAGTASSATWSNPSSASGSSDGVCAEFSGAVSGPIDLTNFSFTIPNGSVITGILVEPKWGTDDEPLFTQLLRGGAPVGTAGNTAGFVSGNCASSSFSSIGGAGDLWGTT